MLALLARFLRWLRGHDRFCNYCRTKEKLYRLPNEYVCGPCWHDRKPYRRWLETRSDRAPV